ncbi:polysaccharide deacetylase family protein [Mycolicibacterium wolinskyi]|uniref:Polysaccharide deacetylase n=1 Tax=Mycolicibacterium wolinskyi TaxID=59750 RepID=A0A1X2EUV6_9MYCO|nr:MULTISPECIES: polysaccharide deacetylase family protein [Mycolicibacterium]MCV7285805.1 polysaccharide deacetylase family protein [Mycolicibacterium wolinskyi]MCV7297139.1 polysaccharide deacetylase family protein [Mycolicibacterium goodii]ORX10041.1 polysaccharide deacetylase [Mycolicibacterium wolinskyi]
MRVTITFDNGPTETTAEVLDILGQRDIKSTFFVIAGQLTEPSARALSERAASEGHWIGNHTLTHSIQFGDAPTDLALVTREIGDAEEIIGTLARPVKLFRPYAGGGVLGRRVFNPAAIDYLQRHDYTCVLWTSVPHDWNQPDQWVQRCLDDIGHQDWSVVVIHDLPTGAMQHLPKFLDELTERGADIVQDFPEPCMPIYHGIRTADLDHLTTSL